MDHSGINHHQDEGFTFCTIGGGEDDEDQPNPEAEVEVEGVDGGDGDAPEEGDEVAEGLQGEEEEIECELNAGYDPPVIRQTKIGPTAGLHKG